MSIDAVLLCFGPGDECQCCGGWLHAGDPPEVPEGEPGLGGGRYCSLDCLDDAISAGWYTP